MNLTSLPRVFCWTKIGTEAGQDLDEIIIRKEEERKNGGGVFFWGIGTPLGQRVWSFVDGCPNPLVLFSPMKSSPRLIDVEPERVVRWTSYLDRNEVKHRVPEHVLVTSKGTTKRGDKNHHYALVCRKTTPLAEGNYPRVNVSSLGIFLTGSSLDPRQVTTIVEVKANTVEENYYDVMFAAELVSPYFVTLVDPADEQLDDRSGLVEGVDFVVCKLCKQRWARLTTHLTRTHNMTKEEYLERFPGAKMQSERDSANISELNREKPKKGTYAARIAYRLPDGAVVRRKDAWLRAWQEAGQDEPPPESRLRADDVADELLRKANKFDDSTEGTDHVVCEVCGYKGKRIARHVKREHGDEVLRAYTGRLTCDDADRHQSGGAFKAWTTRRTTIGGTGYKK